MADEAAVCRHCKGALDPFWEDDEHNHGICTGCWAEAAAEQESNR